MTAPVVESSSTSIASSAPSAAVGSIFNKPATISLYQTCRIIIDRLRRVPDFEGLYLQDLGVAQSPLHNARDPVSDLWKCFRIGASLCHLYNATLPDIELSVRPDASTHNMNACKAEVYHFLLACKKHLNFADEDLFTISELYSENTNGFVKVTRTVSLVLDVLEDRNLLISKSDSGVIETDPEAPKDNKAKVIAELLETERKYVQYLEILQNYMRELQNGEIISADTSHMLFSNLNALVDFQRRFLIGVETTCALPAESQRIGLIFSNLEDAFSVYEPFCANYTHAADLAIEETPKLKRLEHLVEPTYELPSLLIKPIQRICKYPLLLRELLKFTDDDDEFYTELEAGEAAIKRVTDRVNETRRRQENAIVVVDLERRVEDWKGHSIASFGSLLLEDTFQVTKGEVEREYRVYLFERILLCCKENKEVKKNSKSMSITKKPKKRSSLQLKGRIFINNVTDIIPTSRNSIHTLQVYWKGDQDQEFFTLRCRNEENLKQWYSALARLIEEAKVAMAEYRSNQTSDYSSKGGLSNTHLTSLQQMTLNDKSHGGYDSDEESRMTEDTADDNESMNGSAHMSREQSTNGSIRSRSATNESIQVAGYPRYNTAGQRIISSGASKHFLSDTNVSQFSPAWDLDTPIGSKGSPSSSAYPFPRTSYHEPEQINGHARNTAPAMTRTGSREGIGSRQMYANNMARGSNASLNQRPGLSARTRSASSPNMNGFPQRPGISIPEMPPPPMPASGRTSHSGYSASPSGSVKGSQYSPSTGTKVKVNYGEDIFVILLPSEATYRDLTERVERKIRLCGLSTNEVASFRIRYKDEDGDLITINSDDDVQMALDSDTVETSGILTLFATPAKR
ncbi:Rho guanine nucleotide exchange factor scd1 [Taphrina deformans PYCC 5710]|uniref:Rho guanine nucleotide exchange factor scd1 n=1 Tax=Taphrina deformans (strain PYCC 5710 / ATCC 11124 / CBS 356.35 / IMI 108563 / JCM 9778 / NBRC 8474) TaxID=1097556 RepID=R4XCX7_TAPDE|nr:Rho guanine nucleotide exchange factor scd1 [Taphrina deformans PYCC 5710]|eukprot:CCG83468.1 Rho guanine nucleotide exchange factor scd1 [Taphrina deformans PYCC 5710]